MAGFSAYYSTPDSPGAPVRRTRAHLQKAYTRLRIPIRVVSAAAAMFILIFALFPRVETGASDAPNAYITWTDEYLKIDALPHAGWSLPQGGEYHTDNAGLAAAARRAGSLRRDRRRPVLGPRGAPCWRSMTLEANRRYHLVLCLLLPAGRHRLQHGFHDLRGAFRNGGELDREGRAARQLLHAGGRRVLPIHEQRFHGHLLAERPVFPVWSAARSRQK